MLGIKKHVLQKIIGGTGKGHRPLEGAEGPKKEAKGLQKQLTNHQSPPKDLE